MLLALSKALHQIFMDPSSYTGQLKIMVENLKNIMVLLKSNLPSRVGKELLPAEESTLYKEASEQLTLLCDAVTTKHNANQRELQLLKNVTSQLPKLQNGFRDFNATTTGGRGNNNGGRSSALGRGILGDAQQIAAFASELAASSANSIGGGGSGASDDVRSAEADWRATKLGALEVMVLCALMVELSVACIAIRNRMAHRSHVPLLLPLLAIASHFAFYPYPSR